MHVLYRKTAIELHGKLNSEQGSCNLCFLSSDIAKDSPKTENIMNKIYFYCVIKLSIPRFSSLKSCAIDYSVDKAHNIIISKILDHF
jgi:hypothetical protein